MFNVNRVTLLGNVTKDPESHAGKSGQSIVSIGFATNHRMKDSEGNVTNEPDFHRLVCFGNLADFSHKSVKKGAPLYIEGRLHTGRFKTKDGKDASRTDIFVDRLVMLSSNKKGEMQGAVEAE